MSNPKRPLASEDVKRRASFAGSLAAAANALSKAAREARDADAMELLRLGEKPADVARTIGVLSPQIARFSPGEKEPTPAQINARADAVAAAVAALDAVLET